MGIGTNAPTRKLHIIGDGDITNALGTFELYNNQIGAGYQPGLQFRKARGTNASPSNLTGGEIIGSVLWNSYINGSFSTIASAGISAQYTGNGTNNLGEITFSVSGVNPMELSDAGRLGLGIDSVSNPATVRLHVVRLAADITPVVVQGLPNYATEAAGATDAALPSGGLYKVTGSNVLYVKP